MKCPECGREMQAQREYKINRFKKVKADTGEYWWCPNCDVEMLSYSMMKKIENANHNQTRR